MISWPHTPTNYEISAWSILLKFLISTHACLFIHTASYTIIRSILSGTYTNVPPTPLSGPTLIQIFMHLPLYTIIRHPTFIWNSGVIISSCAPKSPYKIKPRCHMLIYKTSHYIKCTKPKQNQTVSICIEKKNLHYLYCNTWTHSLDLTSWPMKFKINFPKSSSDNTCP